MKSQPISEQVPKMKILAIFDRLVLVAIILGILAIGLDATIVSPVQSSHPQTFSILILVLATPLVACWVTARYWRPLTTWLLCTTPENAMNANPMHRLAIFFAAAPVRDYFRLLGAVAFCVMFLSFAWTILEAGLHGLNQPQRGWFEAAVLSVLTCLMCVPLWESIIIPATDRILDSNK